MRPNIEEIRERASKATSGSWKVSHPINQKKSCVSQAKEDVDGWSNHICNAFKNDAEFIAHSRTDIPALLAYIDELENMLLVQTVVKFQESLKIIKTRLGDFQEPWSDREREIDEIARKALEGETK